MRWQQAIYYGSAEKARNDKQEITIKKSNEKRPQQQENDSEGMDTQFLKYGENEEGDEFRR